MEGIVDCLSSIPPTTHLPIVRDVQLLTASGIIVSMVGILKICSRLIDGYGDIADQGKWLSEAKGLLESIRICLKGKIHLFTFVRVCREIMQNLMPVRIKQLLIA